MRPLGILTLLGSLASALLPASSTNKPLPLIIWHGLGDNYAAEGLRRVGRLAEEANPGTYVYNIRLSDDPSDDRTATFFGNLTIQLEEVCETLASHPVLADAPAINALGFSQGGEFLRAYIERCNKPPVRTLVTFGSQHNGISEFQACSAGDWVCKGAMLLLRSSTWSSFVQSRLVPAQYFRTINQTTGLPTPEYLEHSNFLADVNNERETRNKTYARNLAMLAKFVMFVFEDDTRVIPKESGWFAEVNETSKEVIHLRNRTLYTEDWLGLKLLDQRGGLVFRGVPGEHMELDDDDLLDTFKQFFKPLENGDRLFMQSEFETDEL